MSRIWNRKKTFLFIGLLLFLMGSLTLVGVTDSVHISSTHGVLKEQYVMENIRCFTTDEATGFLGKVLKGANSFFSGFADVLFQLTLLIYQLFDFLVEKLYTLNIFSQLNLIVSSLTNHTWALFKANYGTLILIIGLFSVAKKFFMEDAKEALVHFGKIILVLVISGIWFPHASNYLSKLNDYSFALQADVLTIAGQTDQTSALAGGQNVNVANSNATATTIIRNELFQEAAYRPFLLMNYGTTDTEKINAIYAKVTGKEGIPKNASGDYLISKEFDQLNADKQEGQVKAIAKYDKYLTLDQAGYKLILSLLSLIGVFLAGIPLCMISCINLFLQLLAILYQYVLPIIAIISLLPRYSDGLIHSIGNVVKLFLGKGILGFVVLLFCLLNTTIDLLIPPTGFVSVLSNLLIKGIVYWALWHFRGWILRSLLRAMTGHSGDVNIHMDQLNQQNGQGFFEKGKEMMSEFSETDGSIGQSASLALAGLPTEFGNSASEDILQIEQAEMGELDAEDMDRENKALSDGNDAELDEAEREQLPENADVEDADVYVEADSVNLTDDFDELDVEEPDSKGSEHVTIQEEEPIGADNEDSEFRATEPFQEQQNYEINQAVHTNEDKDEVPNKEAEAVYVLPQQETNHSAGQNQMVHVDKLLNVQQIKEGDHTTNLQQVQNNTQQIDLDVHQQTTNKVSANDFERLLRKYRGNRQGRKRL